MTEITPRNVTTVSNEYGMILTDIGLAQVANAHIHGQTLRITHFAVGDGGGAKYTPTQNMTALRNEKWRGITQSVEGDGNNPNRIVTTCVIPMASGGFYIREIGLFDAQGRLIAIGNVPESYKPRVEEGSATDLTLRPVFVVTNAASIELQVDPTVMIASRDYVNGQFDKLDNRRRHALDNISKTEIIYHRGAEQFAPENSIKALQKAAQSGGKWVEFDISETTDGEIVLMHDETVDRTTNGTGKTKTFTFAQIKELRIDSGENVEKYPNMRVPSFEEAVKTCKEWGLKMFVEIKYLSPTLFPKIIETLRRYNVENETTILVSYYVYLQNIRDLSKDVALAYIDVGVNPIMVQHLLNAGGKVSLALQDDSFTEQECRDLQANGIVVNVWTVNNYIKAQMYKRWGVDLITTSYIPEVL